MSRRGGSVRGGDYEEEEHFTRKGPGRSREEFDSYKRRGPAPAEFAPTRERERERPLPEFLREDYGRREVHNGPLVLRQKEVETFSRPRQRSPSPPPPERERVVRTRVVERTRSLSPEPVEIERVRTRFVQRERSESPPPVQRERIVRTRVVERERERSPSPPPERIVRTRMVERERERSPSPPPERERIIRTRVVERERECSRSPPPPERMVRTRILERSRERERTPSPPPERVRTRTIEIQRNRSPSPPPERTTTRIFEREDFKRRPRSSSPVERSRVVVREKITREPSPPSPSPSPPPPPIIKEPAIHQDIITHHHHYNIDHGVLYEPPPAPARAPSPPPPTKASKTRNTEIDIYTSKNETEIDIYKGKAQSSKGSPSTKGGGSRDEDDLFFERDRERLSVRDKRPSRRRSLSTRRDEKWEDEAEYYNRKVEERAYMGEAWNGATKDWAIVDVPPGTERVVMDGIGGGGQEVTWQRYNGVRRSKFIPSREREKERERRNDSGERERIIFKEEKIKEVEAPLLPPLQPAGREMAVYERDYEREEIIGGGGTSESRALGKWNPPPPSRREKEQSMWTEITKDLVVREAIEIMGYDFEETEFFFYVIQYLRYEDVLELVKLSEDIRAERKERIREMAYEKERMERERERERKERKREEKLAKEVGYEDERIYEREVIYDGPARRSGGGRYYR